MNNNNLFDFQSLKNKWVAEQLLERHVKARDDDNQPETLDFSNEKLIGLTIDGAGLFYPDPFESYEPTHGFTVFDNADLRFASLCSCDARYASFQGANLTFARLSGSDLRGADFTGATLACTDFSNVKGLKSAKFELTAQLLSCDFAGSDVSEAKFFITINGKRRNVELQVGANGRLELGANEKLDRNLLSTLQTDFAGKRLQGDFLISAFAQHVQGAQREGALPNSQPALTSFIAQLEKSVNQAPQVQFKAAKPK